MFWILMGAMFGYYLVWWWHETAPTMFHFGPRDRRGHRLRHPGPRRRCRYPSCMMAPGDP